MKTPLITVIVPIYNVEKYLRRCLDSILCQTYTNLEIILVDDESPDNCGAICDEYASKDSRIIVIHQKNGGISAARNTALDIAKGDYIGFVDSDDWIEPTMYENLLKGFEASDNVMITNGMILQENEESSRSWPMFPDKWTVTENRIVRGDRFLYAMLSENSNHFVWSKLYSKELFASIRFRVGRMDNDTLVNYEIGKKMVENNWTMVDIPHTIYHYLIRSDSACTSRKKPQRLDRLANLSEILSDIKNTNPELARLINILQTRSLYLLTKDVITYSPWRKIYRQTCLSQMRNTPDRLGREALTKEHFRKFIALKYCPDIYLLLFKARLSLSRPR